MKVPFILPKQLLAILVFGVMTLLSTMPAAADDAVWIDVRSEAEYQADHIEGVALIPHSQIGEEVGRLNLDKATPIKLFCRSGNRAGVAKTTLENLGYTNVENVGSIGDARKLRGQAE